MEAAEDVVDRTLHLHVRHELYLRIRHIHWWIARKGIPYFHIELKALQVFKKEAAICSIVPEFVFCWAVLFQLFV